MGDTVVVVGLGAMGGSVAKAIRRWCLGVRVEGFDPCAETRRMAARDGVEVVRGLAQCRIEGSVVVFAAPLNVTAALLGLHELPWGRAALATDMASLKETVVSTAAESGCDSFVGAHPMCGTASSGYGAARSDLFEDATVWLCPGDQGKSARTGLAETFWRAVGGRPRIVDAAWHDRLMARASHLPQLVAWALAGVLDDEETARGLLGSGGRDMTRLASSSPDMWLPLLRAAAADDAKVLGRMEQELAALREALEKEDDDALQGAIEKARQWVARES